ncbi:uncharacterized protein LAESUDRAFT_274404 [Laetiporus sulphureus 93-53]|uniref:Uncharacterized protein n=1 Tax=Laetiporus sulphureus 93-53 TaxID=1314785 RepID=A0A165HBJ8_9APHY|nr:uncharacterized protein LAESUDRAFT_274404 [Laetiporus sulphureus 93-53]KZT11509.1 hypothetical protein LAESUDRAFT_274404 [Laetiporus sulphureus 93-53]
MTPAQEIAIKHETKPAEPIPNFSRLLLILHDLRKRGMSRPLRTVVCNMLLHRYGREVFVSASVDTWTQYAAAAESLGIVTLGGEQGDTWISLNETRFLSFQAYLEKVEQQENKPEEPQPPFMPTIPVSAEHANAELPAASQLREDIAQETGAVETRVSIDPTPLDSNDTKGQSSALPPIPIYYYDLLVILETFMKRGVYSPWCEDVSHALLQRNPNIYQYAGVETWEAYAIQASKLCMVVLGSSNGADWIALKPSWYDVVPASYAAEVHDHVSGSAVEALSVQPTLMLDHPHSPTSSVSPQDGHTQTTLSSLAPHFLALVTVLERFRRQNITHPMRSKVNAALMEEDPNAFQWAGVTRWKEFADLAVQEGIVVLGGLRAAPWISLEPTWHGKVHPH